ncbi:GNAT family N-acetyltransferase [Pukyongiella litopenaei]|uniref:N-acetyltransferase family protein n=1 Tax=Pukyongiella litopenaei TaxID=2605946 RepID=A0A2S0MKU0_9RHOB|nr:GNAT family N-acetyltransferase [Pukyongiella litopenaei]AVO36500.1 N-acetyltransferase family protein [Pukyongiella litopenaei]
MRVRPARRGDAGAVCALWNAVIRDTMITFTTAEKTEAALAGLIAERAGAFLVAETGGRVGGFASFGAFRAGPGYARTAEHTIMLAPEMRRLGMGRALMEALEQRARRAGIHVLVGAISSENAGGIAFHRALGFAQVGVMPQVGRKGGRWLDLVLMQKILPVSREDGADRVHGAG